MRGSVVFPQPPAHPSQEPKQAQGTQTNTGLKGQRENRWPVSERLGGSDERSANLIKTKPDKPETPAPSDLTASSS